jgi:capsular exopolysaccharide synthesis family protein
VLTNRVGVCDVLAGTTALNDALQATPVANFSVLTTGPLPSNPGRLVESLRLRSMVAELARNFDMVIVDAPPMLAVSDAVALARASKGLIMVVESGKTTRRMLTDVRARLEGAALEPIGIVLNKVDPRSGSYGYYRKYAQHYSKAVADKEQTRVGDAS